MHSGAIVGSGSLVTFPTLLAVGYSPVVANVSNTVGYNGPVIVHADANDQFDRLYRAIDALV